VATKRDEQAADYRAEAIAAPFAEAAKRSAPVSETGEGQSGLRTERVTLEVTGAPGWRVHVTGIDVESVRVVEETHFDDLAQVAMERDAAIRERDAPRAARITQALTADRFASAVAEADTLRARVAELEPKLAPDANADGESNHATQAASGGGDHFADASKMVPQPRGWLTDEERKAIAFAAHQAPESDFVTTSEGEWVRSVLTALLARSSPPEVVHPECHFDQLSGCSAFHAWNICAADFRKSLAAAGVAVKEVGGE